MNFGKVRVEPETIRIAALIPNCYTTSRAAFFWWSDLFVCIASCHETETLTTGTIAPADLLPPEYRWWNRHFLHTNNTSKAENTTIKKKVYKTIVFIKLLFYSIYKIHQSSM